MAPLFASPASAAASVAATPAGAAALERLRAWPGEHRLAVGLSGGVDSSLTAALLVEAGWQAEIASVAIKACAANRLVLKAVIVWLQGLM